MIMGFLILAAVIVVGVMIFNAGPSVTTGTNGAGTSGGITVQNMCKGDPCPDTLNWAGIISVRNAANTSAQETYDTTTNFYFENGNLRLSVTDTTSGANTLTCGKTYTVRTLSTSGAEGDSGYFLDGTGYTVNEDGSATWTACGSGHTINFISRKHGLPEVRAFDVINDGFMVDNTDTTATDYETVDGTAYLTTSTASGAVNGTDVGSGQEFHVKIYYRATDVHTNANDLGTYILIDAPVATWNTPTVKLNGISVDEASSRLSSDESTQYNSYEYVYWIDRSYILTRSNEIVIDFSVFALGGQNPTTADNISIDFAPVGTFESADDSSILKIGAVDDTSTINDVHVRHDLVFAIV